MVVSVSSQDVPSDWRKKKGKGYLMTRRKKVEGTVRDHLVALRLTELEYETVCDLAKEAGMSVSGYLRQQAIFGKVEIHNHIVAEFPKLDNLLRQFAGIGNNLNQLTRYYHMGGIVSQSMTEELQMCISKIMEMRKEVTELAGEYRGYNKTRSH